MKSDCSLHRHGSWITATDTEYWERLSMNNMLTPVERLYKKGLIMFFVLFSFLKYIYIFIFKHTFHAFWEGGCVVQLLGPFESSEWGQLNRTTK